MAAETGCGRTPYGCAPQGSAARGARSSMEYASSLVCPFSSGLFGGLRALGLVDFLTQPGLRQVPPPPSQEAVQLGAHAPPPAAPTIRGSTHPSLWAGAQGPTQVPGPATKWGSFLWWDLSTAQAPRGGPSGQNQTQGRMGSLLAAKSRDRTTFSYGMWVTKETVFTSWPSLIGWLMRISHH